MATQRLPTVFITEQSMKNSEDLKPDDPRLFLKAQYLSAGLFSYAHNSV